MALIKCPNCGSNVLNDTGECFVCGYPLGNPTGPAFTTYTNNPQQVQQDPSKVEGTQAKSKFRLLKYCIMNSTIVVLSVLTVKKDCLHLLI